MMEIETHPAVIHLAPPDFIAPYVILSVPREHNAYFSNRLLADPEYARTVMENYLKERE